MGGGVIRVWVADGLLLIVGAALILVRFRTRPKIRLFSDAFIGLLLTVLLLLVVEIAFYSLNRLQATGNGPNIVDDNPVAFLTHDDVTGYKPISSHQVLHQVRADDDIIISATYSSDEFSRRITPGTNLEQRENFILFFGCSYTFGWGVNDDETLPYFTQSLTPAYRAYNYGVNGYGPQQMLAKLETNTAPAEVTENDGVLIYTFIDDHINRVIGSSRFHTNRGNVTPYYDFDPEGQLVRYGDFVSGRPVTAALYGLIGISQIAQYFNLNLPLYQPRHYELTARVIAESCNLFAAQFGSDDCYVLLYPGNGQSIKPYLEANHIKVLDYSRLFEQLDDKSGLSIPYDGHPTGRAYRLLAEQLTKDLQNAR